MVERTGLELVADVDDREIEKLGRTFQWVRRQTEDVRRSLVGLNSVADRQVHVNRLIRDEKKSQADAEGIVASKERRTLEDRAGGVRRMMNLSQQAGRTVPMAGGGAGGIARGVTGGLARGAAGKIAGMGAAGGGLGAGAMLAGGAIGGALIGGGLLAARGFGLAKEQATAYEALERRVRAVGVAYGTMQRAVQDVGIEFGTTRMETAAASEAFTQFAGQIEDVNAFAMAMGSVTAAARGFGLRPEQLAGEVGQFQRLVGFDVTQEPAQTQRFLLQMADVMGRTQMGGRGAEFIKSTERLASIAADISGVVAPERILALQGAIGAGGRQGLMGARGAEILERVHQAITQPGGEMQQAFMTRALGGEGRDIFQIRERQRMGIFGTDVLEDVMEQVQRMMPGFRRPTAERLSELQGGAEMTPLEARMAQLMGFQTGVGGVRGLELFRGATTEEGTIKDLDASLREIADIAESFGVTVEQMQADPEIERGIFAIMAKDGTESREALTKMLADKGQIESLKSAETYLNNMNTTLGGPILDGIAIMAGGFTKIFGRRELPAGVSELLTPTERYAAQVGGGLPERILGELSVEELEQLRGIGGRGMQARVSKEEFRRSIEEVRDVGTNMRAFYGTLLPQAIKEAPSKVINFLAELVVDGETLANVLASVEDAITVDVVPQV